MMYVNDIRCSDKTGSKRMNKNRVAVVTGATSGIGEAVARAFCRENINLVIHGRDRKKLATIAGETDAEPVAGDITGPGMASKLRDAALDRYGRCDIVVNNAGLIETGTVEDIDIEKVCEMVRVNVEAAYRVAYTFVRHFKQQNSGYLVNISSVMGTKVRATAGAYAGTKYAIEALSEALRLELSKTDIRVTCIQPGLVKTRLHRRWKTPPGKLLDIPKPLLPQDVAEAVIYILKQPPHIRIPVLMMLPRDHVI